jgi:hypothetical protein
MRKQKGLESIETKLLQLSKSKQKQLRKQRSFYKLIRGSQIKTKSRLKRRLNSKCKCKKKIVQKNTAKVVPIKPKTPTQATKALESKKKVVRFDNSIDDKEVVPALAKSTKSGHAIKPYIIFEQYTN